MSGVVYPNSPIREAVFDVRTQFDTQPDLKTLDAIYELIKSDYPRRDVTNTQSVSFEFKIGENPKLNQGNPSPVGLRLTSADGLQIVQLQMTGFSFSRLRPYQKWDLFSAEAKRLFKIYIENTHPKYCERVALRYINAFEVPEKKLALEDYLLTGPKLAKNISQDIKHFLSRVVFKDDQSESLAVLSETMGNEKPEMTTLIFDIDVFQDKLQLDPNSEAFSDTLEALKEFRTKIFHESLTEKAKDLFS